MNNPEIAVTKQDDISIDRLVELTGQGLSVVRSAHVGNLSPYNMSLAASGIPILSVDHNITGVDKNYRPETICLEGRRAQIAPLGQLTCRSVTNDGVRLVDQHIDAAQDAIPGANIFTNTSYVQQNEGVFREVIAAALTCNPSCFERVVTADGRAQKSHRAEYLARSGRILQLPDDSDREQDTAIIPNLVDIVGGFVVEVLNSGNQTVFHLSGPDMVNYMSGLTNDINSLYAQIIASTSLGNKLPEILDVQLVPTVNARFATTVERESRLTDLMSAIDECDQQIAECAASRKIFFSTPASKDEGERVVFLDGVKRAESGAELGVIEALMEIPEILANSGDASQLSQYDVIQEGGLSIAAQNTSLTMRELQLLTKRLTRYLMSASP